MKSAPKSSSARRLRGSVKAAYAEGSAASFVPFLAEEQKIIGRHRAHKISGRIFHEELSAAESRSNWEAILLFLQNTDHNMLFHVSEKMLALLAKKRPGLYQGYLPGNELVGI